MAGGARSGPPGTGPLDADRRVLLASWDTSTAGQVAGAGPSQGADGRSKA